MDSQLQERIDVLYDEKAPGEAKLVAADELVDAGTAAIPLLIACLERDDNPLFLKQCKVATGPMHAAPPAVLPIHVKYQVETMLYRIIDPTGLSAELEGEHASGPGALLDRGALDRARPPLAYVQDWAAWWSEHQGETVEELRRWSQRELDRLWDEINAKTTAPPG